MWPAANSATGRTSSTKTSRRANRAASSWRSTTLDAVAVTQVGVGQAFEPGDVCSRHVAQSRPQLTDPIAGQPIEDARAVAAGCHEAGPGHGAQVVGRVGHALADLLGDLVDGTFALGEQVHDLGAAAAGQRLGDLRESVLQGVLGGAITH